MILLNSTYPIFSIHQLRCIELINLMRGMINDRVFCVFCAKNVL
ncbi:hypothetical protein GM3709_2525 [Geminocystis sp. NIES-3709]|nr:hypothetical protein GM3709_2525 [Geminocystis sp. NIES-3709]